MVPLLYRLTLEAVHVKAMYLHVLTSFEPPTSEGF